MENNPSDVKLRECREAFEHKFQLKGYDTNRIGNGDYSTTITNYAWFGWKELWNTRHTDYLLEMAEEALEHYKDVETLSSLRGDCPVSTEATKALATIEQMEK